MSVLAQMKDILSPLGIYSLDDNSLVVCELKVYASQLEKLHEKLNTLLRECFISSAESYGIEKVEELFERARPDLAINERRALIGRYMTLNNNDFSDESIKGQLKLAGAPDNFTSGEGNERLSFPDIITMSDITEKARYLSIIKDIVPAHLDIDIGIKSMSWDEWDGLDLSFGSLDRADLHFDLIDN